MALKKRKKGLVPGTMPTTEVDPGDDVLVGVDLTPLALSAEEFAVELCSRMREHLVRIKSKFAFLYTLIAPDEALALISSSGLITGKAIPERSGRHPSGHMLFRQTEITGGSSTLTETEVYPGRVDVGVTMLGDAISNPARGVHRTVVMRRHRTATQDEVESGSYVIGVELLMVERVGMVFGSVDDPGGVHVERPHLYRVMESLVGVVSERGWIGDEDDGLYIGVSQPPTSDDIEEILADL